MFGKKKPQIKTSVSANFEVIPQDFYGTRDPVVHYNGQQKKFIKDVGYSSGFSLFNFLKNKKILIIIISILFLGVIGGITWYYLVDAGIIKKEVNKDETKVVQTEVKEVESIVQTKPVVEEVVTTTTEIAATTENEVPQEELSNQEMEIYFPRVLLTNSVDLDNDGLTDLEEEIFGTDSGTSDTDSDGYYDGQEVNNLYNPRGIAPVKIIDSGLVTEYANPIWQYRIYYPANWQIGEVDKEYRQVIFSTVTGDYVEVLVFQKENNESFADWFARKATAQKITDLQNFKNRFQEDGQKRQDSLVNYFVRDNNIYVVSYHPSNENGFIPFRHVVQMMVQSFRPTKTMITIPEQTVLPTPPTEAEITDIFSNNVSPVATNTVL